MALLHAILFVFGLSLSAHLVFPLPSTTVFNVADFIQRSTELTQFLSKSSNSSQFLPEPSHGSFGLYPGIVLLRPGQYKDYRSLTIARLQADLERVRYINYRIEVAVNQQSSIEPELVEAPVIISGKTITEYATNFYMVRVGIGKPNPQYLYLILDTGSDISWVKCYVEGGFDPYRSRSYRMLPCDSQECNYLVGGDRGCLADKCLYYIVYVDGTSSMGHLISETLTFGSSSSVDNMAIGCHIGSASSITEPGMLGLGGDLISVVSQLKASSFSYCLVDRDSTSSSTLDFNSSTPSDSIITPMIRNNKTEMKFYVGLTGISVSDQLLPIPPAIFELQEDGSGGVLLDSGTQVTRLPRQVYELLRDSFAQKAEVLPPPIEVSSFLENCYDLSGMDIISLPTVSFHFARDKKLGLLPLNYMLHYGTGIFCFAFTPSDDLKTILSNTWQQKMRVSFDITNALIGFSPNKC